MTDTAIDTTRIEITVDRYFSAWNETDEDARADLIAAAFTDDARYVDPLSDAVGPDAITAMMGAVQQQYPDMTVRRATPVDLHHDVLRFGWTITTADGSTLVDGIDVAAAAGDGRLADVRGFFGTGAE